MDLIYSAGNSETAKQVGLALAIFLALDMIVVLFLASLTSVFFLTIIGGLVFLIEGLIVYFSYSISKMSYRITDNELVIEFKPSKMRIPFNYISDVHQATTTLNWRLFGASLPGLHWGVFQTKEHGRVYAYTTKYNGELVLLELQDGTKLILSPVEREEFTRTLDYKIKSKETIEFGTLDFFIVNRKISNLGIAFVAIAYVILIIYVMSIYPKLPQVIPVHFGFYGKPNRWGDKSELLWILGVAAIFPILNAIFGHLFGKYSKGFAIFLVGVFTIVMILFGAVINMMVSYV